MTANQRRQGFRLPWTAETDEGSTPGEAMATTTAPGAESAPATTNGHATVSAVPTAANEPAPADGTPGDEVSEAAVPANEPAPAAEAAPAVTPLTPEQLVAEATIDPGSSPEFMRELVAAMRRVADEARRAEIGQVQAKADERIKRLEADAERRREELERRAEADIAGVGEWAKAETERIRVEADQRVASRRGQLEQQLAADKDRAEAEARALRDRVSEYERELDAYHAQLAEINDPAAFAAAAKRMPRPPVLDGAAPAPVAPPPTVEASADEPTEVPAAAASTPAAANGRVPAAEVHPAEEEVLASRLAELDSKLGAEPTAPTAPATPPVAEPAEAADPVTTEVVVKGLGSFGAITGFRQSLAGVDGIDGVALSLAQTGDFVFRATHRPGFDLAAAIAALEGDGAKIEPRPQGGLQVTLDRAR